MVHVGSICELPDGRLAAAWYGGTREGARDVSIFFAMNHAEDAALWTLPKIVVERISASRELRRYIKKVGNPILFAGPGNQLWLIYVSITVGGWSGSSLNAKISHDIGNTWGPSQRLTLSPFLNISELVRNKPLPVRMGGFALPIYHECFGDFPEILWIRSGQCGEKIYYRKTRMTGGRSFIQPSVTADGPYGGIAFYRCRTDEKGVGMAVTDDAGATWSEPRILDLPNSDSAINALILSDGGLLLALNDSKQGRENMRLAVSHDRGSNWTRIATLEDSPGHVFSYPYMIRTRDGLIHLVYTWQRKRIKHVVFNEAWINQQIERTSG